MPTKSFLVKFANYELDKETRLCLVLSFSITTLCRFQSLKIIYLYLSINNIHNYLDFQDRSIFAYGRRHFTFSTIPSAFHFYRTAVTVRT